MTKNIKLTDIQRSYIYDLLAYIDWPDYDIRQEIIQTIISDIESVLNNTYRVAQPPITIVKTDWLTIYKEGSLFYAGTRENAPSYLIEEWGRSKPLVVGDRVAAHDVDGNTFSSYTIKDPLIGTIESIGEHSNSKGKWKYKVSGHHGCWSREELIAL